MLLSLFMPIIIGSLPSIYLIQIFKQNMNLTARQKRKLKISLQLIAFGITAGLFYTALSNGLSDFYPLLNGIIIGFVLAIVAAVFELFFYEKGIRKYKFIVVLAMRSIFYFLLIITVILIEIGAARMIKDDLSFSQLLQNEKFNDYIFGGEFRNSVFYTFALSLFINFNRQMSRKLDSELLLNLITGRYYHPVERNMIFMFLNVPSSDEIIKKIGRLNFHRFINEIVYDLTSPILANHGIIYQYVEDEIVITWEMKKGLKNARVLRCFFDIKDNINQLKGKYLKKYGVLPDFNAAIHCGKVIKGEIGYIKSELVYHGDVLNTTSRILGVCQKISKEILASDKLLKLLNLPVIYKTQKCGDINLKGKKDAMGLFSIAEVENKLLIFN